MNRVEVHRAWAPPEAAWTPWVKPILFAYLKEDREPETLSALPPWIEADLLAPLAQGKLFPGDDPHPYRRSQRLRNVALVVDLPGKEGPLLGAWLAGHGFRPVPLYNAIPDPRGVVKLSSVMETLIDAVPALAELPPDAPPAFLLDSNRLGPGARLEPGRFDNRSICFPADFPSPSTLWDAGLRRAVLIREDLDSPAADLAPILHAWQERGLEILLLRNDAEGPLRPLHVARPSWWDRLNRWFDSQFLRRVGKGGAFGGFIPEPRVG